MTDEPTIGHNSGVDAGRLLLLINRTEKLNEQRDELLADRNEIFLEAKSAGYDVKAVRAVIRMRAQDPAKRQEEEAMLDVYRRAVGL